VELARYNIRVNSIHPGLVDTPMSQGVTKDESHPPVPAAAVAGNGDSKHYYYLV
jgi:3alpha(or 20beta)-hydroxysteroid dehydrogenase